MKPILLLDLGGVLVHIRYNRFLETLGLNDKFDERKLLERLSADGRLYESGKISTVEFFSRLRGVLDSHDDEKRLHAAWFSILDGEIEGMRDLVEKLAAQSSLCLLSNTNELHITHAKKAFPILSFFQHFFLSFEIGAMKPSPEIYRHVVQALEKKPDQLFFVDDLERNVRGARDAGIRSELFTGVESIKKTLEDHGFKV